MKCRECGKYIKKDDEAIINKKSYHSGCIYDAKKQFIMGLDPRTYDKCKCGKFKLKTQRQCNKCGFNKSFWGLE